jgi:ABC-type antimicrobial peptide transport system permease subunit
MLKNYLITIFRNMRKQKGYTFINISGLAIGMASCILIFIWVQDELSINRMHEKEDQIYLVRTWQQYGSVREQGSGAPPALGPALKAEYAEVINSALVHNGNPQFLFRYKDKKFKERIHMSDPAIFDIFTLPILQGNHLEAETNPHVMMISEDIAEKYFPDENPVGETIIVDNQYQFKIIGLMKNRHPNSTIGFDIWIPITFTREIYRKNYIDTWYNLAFRLYVELDEHSSYRQFNLKIADRVKKAYPESNTEPFLYPFKNMYLKLWGNQGKINTFVFIACLILLIACINFMNLTTARSTGRAKEVGLRKVSGAQQKQLIYQFFGESYLYVVISMFLSLLLVEFLLPGFQEFTGKKFTFSPLTDPVLLSGIIGVVLITGLIAGTYPALFLSSFKPVTVLSGLIRSGVQANQFRRILVVTQFTLSIILIIATIVIFNQSKYLKNIDLGFDKEQIVYMPVEGEIKENYLSFKNELSKNPDLSHITFSTHSPTGVYWNGQDWNWEGRDPAINPLTTYLVVDEDFLETFRMKMVEGRFFSSTSLTSNQIIINKKFADIMGGGSVINKMLTRKDETLEIIGVVNDFHYKPAYRRIGPLIIFNNPDIKGYNYMFAKINTGNVPNVLEFLKAKSEEFNPAYPFQYHFLDDDYARMYVWIEDQTFIIRAFAVLAIFISCLGLFGLASYMAEKRTKEIGVRKVLGASVPNLFLLLSKEFLKLILIANAIAWPLAWIIMVVYLQDFAYRVSVGLDILLLSGLVVLVIAMITVSYQSFKAARSNPVEALRYE